MNTALIVIDVQQEYFVGRLPIVYPERHAALDRIITAMHTATARGLPVIVVQHAAAEPDSPVFRPGTPEQELHPSIAVAHRDHLVTKALPGSFTGTDLGEWIAEHGVTELVVCGFMTHMCCDTTTRQAAHLGLSVVLLGDATGTIDLSGTDGAIVPARQVHETELAVLGSRFASVRTVNEWVRDLEARDAEATQGVATA